MADPCIQQSPCVSLAMVGGALQATAVISPDANNALVCRTNGMYAQGHPMAALGQSPNGPNIPNSPAVLSWTSVTYDTASMTNLASPTRLTITKAGVYLLYASWGTFIVGGGTMLVSIRKNGAFIGPYAIGNFEFNVVLVDVAAGGDYYEFWLEGGIASSTGGTPTPWRFSAMYIGPTA